MTQHWWTRVTVGCTTGLAITGMTIVGVVAQPAANRGTFGAPGAGAWVTAWATSQQALGDTAVTNATVRLIARVTIPGETVRIRLDNGYGADSVRIGRAALAYRVQGPLVAAGSTKPLTFGGAVDAILPPGGTLWSDPVAMPVLAQQDLAISLFIPGQNVRPSQHTNAVVTSYRTPNGGGDRTADESRAPFTETLTATWWLKSVEVQSSAAAGTIVAFGDSITDGTCTMLDAHDRWVDVLSVRLGLDYDAALRAGRPAKLKAIINEGIGGNTVTREVQPLPDSTPAVERLERDVLSHHGITDVIVFIGTNDLRREGTVAQITTGLSAIISRIRAAGTASGGTPPRVVGVTMIPRHNVAPSPNNTGWNDEKSRRRREVNEWIRTKAGFDAVLDFDAMVRDAKQPDLIQPPLNCGDGIHPSPAGYYTIGRAIPLAAFGSDGR